MRRFRWTEITARRVLAAAQRRLTDVPHRAAWTAGTGIARANMRRLSALHDKHRGERCFVLGNGPSLRRTDLTRLEGEVAIGQNRIYLLADELGLDLSYYVCINELVLEQFSDEIARLELPKFVNWNRRSLFDPHDERMMYLRFRFGLNDRFSGDVRRPLCSGGTVTFAALQLAFYLGFGEVILLGVDHHYKDSGTPNKTETKRTEDEDHFTPDYFPKGSRWQLPDLLRSEVAYAAARQGFERAGRRVIDATVDGRCPVFERADFRTLF